MAWIESHQEIARHPKTRRLMRELSINRRDAIGLVHCLWWWAIDQAPDGDLTTAGPFGVAEAVFWDDDEQRLWDALIASGWLNGDGTIHDHDAYRGKYRTQKANAAKRQADKRARDRDEAPAEGESQDSHGDVTRDENVTHANAVKDSDIDKDNDRETPVVVSLAPKPTAKRPVYPDDFEEFWRQYPTGHGTKTGSLKHWLRMSPDDRRDALAGLARWNASERWQEGFAKDCEGYLGLRMWEGDPPAPKQVRAPTGATNNGRPDFYARAEALRAAERSQS